MNISKKLVTAGCSFTYGYGLDDPSIQCWPAVLAEMLGYDLINLAVPAAGNSFITNSIVDYHADNTDADLVIIAWSNYMRMDFCSSDGKLIHLSHNSKINSNLKDLIYKDNVYSPYQYKKHLNNINLLQGWLMSKNINYVMFDSMSGNHDGDFIRTPLNISLSKQIDRSRYIGFGISSMDTMTDPAHRLADGHPDHRAHARMAEVLRDFIVNM